MKNPLGNDVPQCLVYPPSLAVLEECIKVEDVATLLFGRDGPYIAQLLEGNYFSNAARSRITTNLQQEVRDHVYTFMYPEEYTVKAFLTLTPTAAPAAKKSSTTAKMIDECQ